MSVTYPLQWPERLEAWTNGLFFPLRGRLKWRRRGYRETGATAPTDPRTQQLLERYRPAYADRFAPSTLTDNLEWLALLDGIRDPLPWCPAGPINALDVGSKNFYYAPTLLAFWQSFGQPVTLTGIELDAYRVYRDGFSRADYAAWYTRNLATFRPGNVLDLQGRYHVISHFYPFVLPDPLVKWGLPLSEFRPDALLDHILSLLEPGGLLLVVNQGRNEWDAQDRLYAERSLVPILVQPLKIPNRPTAYISAICKFSRHGLV